MVTNSIAQLAPGEGCYNFALNAQGHIQADLTAFLHEDSILLETSRDQIAKLLDHLNRFIIMDEVELTDITAQRRGLLIAGPDASRLLAAIGLSSDALAPLQLTHLDMARGRRRSHPRATVRSSRSSRSGRIPPPSIRSPMNFAMPERSKLTQQPSNTSASSKARPASAPTSATKTSRRRPAQRTRALHFTKGCYLGQEIVERIHSRGGVHRAFSGFALTGALPAPGTQLEAEGKPVGGAHQRRLHPSPRTNPRRSSLPSASSAARPSKTLRPATSLSPIPEAQQPPSPCPMQSPEF